MTYLVDIDECSGVRFGHGLMKKETSDRRIMRSFGRQPNRFQKKSTEG